ncbi:hypothetical protein PFISCL1PPCAC_5217, partial [Pristionchus fissidentatus]
LTESVSLSLSSYSSPAQIKSFLDLPDDVILAILSFLPGEQLYGVRWVSRRLYVLEERIIHPATNLHELFITIIDKNEQSVEVHKIKSPTDRSIWDCSLEECVQFLRMTSHRNFAFEYIDVTIPNAWAAQGTMAHQLIDLLFHFKVMNAVSVQFATENLIFPTANWTIMRDFFHMNKTLSNVHLGRTTMEEVELTYLFDGIVRVGRRFSVEMIVPVKATSAFLKSRLGLREKEIAKNLRKEKSCITSSTIDKVQIHITRRKHKFAWC